MLPYTNETVLSPDGVACKVLDSAAVSFDTAAEGRKTAETLVRRAEGGEAIETKNSEGKVESVYTAQPGDAIFINLHNPDDMYVPGNPDGTRWQFRELAGKGYEITGEDQDLGGVRVRNTAVSKILHEAVEEPTCIRHAWGDTFYSPGATLKLNANGSISGIDKEAFDATWEITSKANVQAAIAAISPRP